MNRCGCAFLFSVMLIAGCQATPPEVAADASRATGITDAIVVRDEKHSAADQTRTIGNRLELQQAVRLALSYDPRIQGALAHVRAALADANQARLLPNPLLNVDMRFPAGNTGSRDVEVAVTEDLLGLIQKPGQIKAADQRLRAAAADAVTTVLDVIAEVEESYASAQSIEAQRVSLDQRAKIVDQLLDVARKRLDAGEGTRLDVLTLQSQRAQLDLEVTDLRIERAEQRLALARRTGHPRDAAEWELDPWQAPAAVGASEAIWIDAALVRRPEIQSHYWELAALGEEVKLASWSELNGLEAGAHGERNQGEDWIVGPTVSVPIPIFDFGQAARAKAKAQRDQAHHELHQQRLEVIEQVRVAYATYSAARASLEQAQQQLLPLQEGQRQQAEIAYRAGDTDLTTLLLAETALQETRAKLVELQEKVTVGLVHLRRAAGGGGVAAEIQPTTAPAGG